MAIRRLYSDVHKNYGKDGKDISVSNLDAIEESIDNILTIRPGELLFNRAFGSSIHGLLFEPITPFTALLLKNEVVESIERNESRISLIKDLVRVVPVVEQNTYIVVVPFVVNTDGTRGEYTQTFQAGV